MKLHPASLAVGAALAIGVAILSAQQIVGSPVVEVKVTELPVNTPIRALAGEPEMKFLPPGSTWTLDPNGRRFQIAAIRDFGSHGTNNLPCFVDIKRGAQTWASLVRHQQHQHRSASEQLGLRRGPRSESG